MIWLFHNLNEKDRIISFTKSNKSDFKWIFLGGNYSLFKYYKKKIKGQNINDGREFNKHAESLKTQFIDLIGDLGIKHNSFSWWSSRIAEKNIMVNDLFLNCCNLSYAIKKIEYSNSNLLIISDSYSVLESINSCNKILDKEVKWINYKPKIYIHKLKLIKKSILNAFQFIKDNKKPLQETSYVRQSNKKNIIIKTFINEDSIKKPNQFYDIYFPNLSSMLQNEGYNVYTLPILYNMKRNYQETWKTLNSLNQKFINPENFLNLKDKVWSIYQSLKQFFILNEKIFLDEIDVTKCFKESSLSELFDRGSLDSISWYRLPKYFKAINFKVDIFIQEFEGLIHEKILTLGFRKYLPKTKLVGYQHASIFPNLLSFFISKKERNHVPLPDKIICSGDFFYNLLKKSYYPKKLLRVGPALRYQYLIDSDTIKNTLKPNYIILVPLPIEMEMNFELLDKIEIICKEAKKYTFLVKPHPMLDIKVIENHKIFNHKNINLINGKLKNYIHSTKLVIGMGTSVLQEFNCFNIPVIIVGRDIGIDRNPYSIDKNIKVYSIGKNINEILKLLQKPIMINKISNKSLNQFYNPIFKNNIRSFVEDL